MSSLRGSTGRRGSGPVFLHFLKRARPPLRRSCLQEISTLPPHVEGTVAAIGELHASHYTVHVGRNAAVA